MAKVKMVLSWCIPMVLITVGLITPAIAEAKSIKIWPDQVKAAQPNIDYYQSVGKCRNNIFYAPLTLPVGATISRATFYHLGEGSPASTQLLVVRVRMGEVTETLGSGVSADSTGEIIQVDIVSFDDPIIRAGYRYYIFVQSANNNSNFLGAKITYHE